MSYLMKKPRYNNFWLNRRRQETLQQFRRYVFTYLSTLWDPHTAHSLADLVVADLLAHHDDLGEVTTDDIDVSVISVLP